ncbi:MAG: Alpha-ketoglutarate-dependent taurine dioxygenase [Francisellaceae bacterium]|nr:Alpha-ketoglutarate-dependent taurine dioxygenase [Francisellaceae bacterium]
MGIDLSQILDSKTWNIIKKAFDQYSVLVFRNQNITVEQQKDFGRQFGELAIHEHLLPFTLEGHPECMVLHNNEKKPPGLNYWHTDNSGWEKPPLATMLYNKITPVVGGDTLYGSMYLAYEALSKPMQNFLKPLKAFHDVKKAFGTDYSNLQKVLVGKGLDPLKHFSDYPVAKHPIIRTHPETKKKALYISQPYVTHIEGLTNEESTAILNFLYKHIERHEFIYRHKWQTNDLVIWDNRCTQHYAVADYFPEERLMHRLNISGETPE